MKPKHTPGPWYSEENNVFTVQLGYWIAEMGKNKSFTKNNDERHANARLIAAAPELLEALELALVRLEQLNSPRCSNALTIGKVYGVIAKARGES